MIQHFELLDSDGESMGILKTDLSYVTVALEWRKYYNETETDNLGIEEFIDDILFTKYPNAIAERFFIDSSINP